MNRDVAAGFQEVAAQLPPNFEAFQSEALAAGCDEALVREWQPNAVPNAHTHRFGVEAIVVRGEMWLTGTGGDRTWHLTPGGTFRLAAGTLHGERYGQEGATYWVGRRQVPAPC